MDLLGVRQCRTSQGLPITPRTHFLTRLSTQERHIVSAMPDEIDRGETHQRFATRSTSDPEDVLAFAVEAARLAADDKCEDVVLLDVRDLSQLSDYLVLCSGTSDRQMRTVADEVEELGAKMGFPLFRRDIDDRTTWVVVDCVDVVVHVFEPNARAHYDLEMLWADAPRLEWERGKPISKPAKKKPAETDNGETVAVKKKKTTTRKKKTTSE